MKFFDNVGDPKTDSMFNFICNIICMAVLAPIKFFREVVKKTVYLSRKQIDKLFFTSMCFSLGLTVVSVLIRYYQKQFSLLTGRLPMIVMIIADVIMFILYAMFSTTEFIVYDSNAKRLVHKETKVIKPAGKEEVEKTVVESEIVRESGVIESSETVEGSAVIEKSETTIDPASIVNNNESMRYDPVLDSQEIRDYQEKLKNGVRGLEEFQEITMKDAEENLKKLKESIDAVTPPSKFLNQDAISRISSSDNFADLDEEVLANIEEIPADFRLFS